MQVHSFSKSFSTSDRCARYQLSQKRDVVRVKWWWLVIVETPLLRLLGLLSPAAPAESPANLRLSLI